MCVSTAVTALGKRTDPVGLDNRLYGSNGDSGACDGECSLAATSDNSSFRSHSQTRRQRCSTGREHFDDVLAMVDVGSEESKTSRLALQQILYQNTAGKMLLAPVHGAIGKSTSKPERVSRSRYRMSTLTTCWDATTYGQVFKHEDDSWPVHAIDSSLVSSRLVSASGKRIIIWIHMMDEQVWRLYTEDWAITARYSPGGDHCNS